jgi:hypothetical protein
MAPSLQRGTLLDARGDPSKPLCKVAVALGVYYEMGSGGSAGHFVKASSPGRAA